MGGWSAPAALPVDVSPLWINGVDSHSNARHPVKCVRTLARIPRAVLLAAPAAWLAACSGSLLGATPREELGAPAPGVVVGTGGGSASDGMYSGPSMPQPVAPPPTSNDGRDRQFEILIEAVTALRQEVSRSSERSSDLARETERLRSIVASLRRHLTKSREENRVLRDHVHALEKRLEEVRTPPLDGAEEARPSEAPTPAEAAGDAGTAPPAQ